MCDFKRINKAVHAVQTADLPVLDRPELVDVIAEIGLLESWLEAAKVGAARRGRELAAAGKSAPAASLLTNNGQVSGKQARAATERETVCDSMPKFEEALAAGEVSAGHIDALANAGRRLSDEQRLELNDMQDALLAKAGQSSVEDFERECRDLKRLIQTATSSDVDELDKQRAQNEVKRWVEKSSGMHYTMLILDPLSDNKLWPAVDRKLASLRQQTGTAKAPFRQLQAEAFVNAVVDGADQPSGEPPLPEISVLVDYITLVDGLHAAGVCETSDGTPIPVSAVRRLCCDATIAPFVMGADSEVLDAGHTRRTANRQQRRALRAMHRSCAHPGCTVVFDACRIHHVIWWAEHAGPTNLDNLLPLCEQHHHLVHEGGWSLKLKPGRIAIWKQPDGTTFHVGPTIDRLPTTEPAKPEPGSKRKPGKQKKSSTQKQKPVEPTKLVPLPTLQAALADEQPKLC